MKWRWESVTRWYEAELMCDLFGDWLVVRRWGGLYSELLWHKNGCCARFTFWCGAAV